MTHFLEIYIYIYIAEKNRALHCIREFSKKVLHLRHTLGSPIKFKHLFSFTNKIQTKLSFAKIIKFNVTIYVNLIGEFNALHLRFILS